MTNSELNSELDKALESFKAEIQSRYAEGSSNPATEHDINELARQTFYTLDEFRKSILKYLDER